MVQSYDVRIHPFFQKQSVWEKMPIIEDGSGSGKVARRIVSLEEYLRNDQGGGDEDGGNVLILVTEAEYSSLDERILEHASDSDILGLLIIQEEKYFVI